MHVVRIGDWAEARLGRRSSVNNSGGGPSGGTYLMGFVGPLGSVSM